MLRLRIRKRTSARRWGIVTKIDGKKATVTLTNGLTLRDISIAKDVKTDVMGRLCYGQPVR